MIRRLPVFATLIVLVAVGVMIGLGFWQLDRMAEKETLLTRYRHAQRVDTAMVWPRTAEQVPARLFHQTRITCSSVTGVQGIAGRNRNGEAGLAHYASCLLADGTAATVVLGWSRDPAPRTWQGGEVSGTIAPGPRLVADPPLAGLQANALPDPRDLPNNHLSYAVQWFLFAGVALVIFALAVRKRLAGTGTGG